MRLLDRLSTDRGLRPLVAQFVPLKITTSGQEWGDWARRYRAQGAFIPKVYIVRADGEQLHGSSGSPSSKELKQMMVETLLRSGRLLAPRQLALLKQSVDEAKTAQSQNDRYTAVVKLSSLKGLGPLGDLQCYAEPALEADKMVKELTEQGATQLQTALNKLQQSPDSFEAALEYTEAERIFGRLPTLKKEFAAASGQVRRLKEAQSVVSQAKTISKARVVLHQGRSGPRRAKQYLQKVITKYPDTPASQIALNDMAAISSSNENSLGKNSSPASADDASTSQTAKFRQWSDSTGEFQVEAKLVKVTSGTLLLQNREGKTLRVPIQRLSERDRQFLADLEDASAKPASSSGAFREWTDNTGNFKIEAKLVDFKKGQVRLQRRNGKVIALPFARLSKQDQQYLMNVKTGSSSTPSK